MQVLHQLPHMKDRDLLVGVETADDAAVYRISEELALISTLDFFPPIVDDPYTFGQIAAANALSDVYAMGGAPRLAMNIVCFPKELALSVLNEIIKGSMDKLIEAGALLVGGHSIEDREVKYGLSVTGFVHPDRITTNSKARPGDVLVLTKPIGSGVIASALKAGRIDEVDAWDAISSMKALNRAAAEAAGEVGVNACTDVTGFGLLGHAMEVARASGVNLVIRSSGVRFFQAALDMVKKRSNRPRSIASNRAFLMKDTVLSGVNEAVELLLLDPQTSGGLLISVAGERSALLIEKLRARGVEPAIVGHVVPAEEGWRISVT
ncbi:MAG: selenide, water dikinase SelD [Deltaproteobacteria bacterium]|nr:selenide, water dikinase SelD [Deltaproteobacteria bacterium]